jgi:cytochrome c oxidase assembly factor 6
MGWFGASSAAPQEEEVTAVTRSGRQHCWDARDAYFACLDAAQVLTPGTEGAGACRAEVEGYTHNCAKSWVRASAPRGRGDGAEGVQVEYFNQRRVLAERQKGMLAQAANQAKDAARR